MIGCNLEQFAISPANLEHLTLHFDNLVDKTTTFSMILHGIFLLHYEYTCASKWTRNGKHKLKLVRLRPVKKIKGL